MLRQMIEAGDHELALRVVSWLIPHDPQNQTLQGIRRKAHRRLLAKYQNIDAFKFYLAQQTQLVLRRTLLIENNIHEEASLQKTHLTSNRYAYPIFPRPPRLC